MYKNRFLIVLIIFINMKQCCAMDVNDGGQEGQNENPVAPERVTHAQLDELIIMIQNLHQIQNQNRNRNRNGNRNRNQNNERHDPDKENKPPSPHRHNA
ncbi:hypothetical protein ACQ4LE_004725 [Meloidogyne hapla]